MCYMAYKSFKYKPCIWSLFSPNAPTKFKKPELCKLQQTFATCNSLTQLAQSTSSKILGPAACLSFFAAFFSAAACARAFEASSFSLASCLASASARAFWHGPTWWSRVATLTPSSNLFIEPWAFSSPIRRVVKQVEWVYTDQSWIEWSPGHRNTFPIYTEKQLLEVVCGIKKILLTADRFPAYIPLFCESGLWLCKNGLMWIQQLRCAHAQDGPHEDT